MTGQVKEEILTRFAELGIRVQDGCLSVSPALLRAREFEKNARPFCYLDVDNTWQDLVLPASSLAFTWCQVPFVYVLGDTDHELTLEFDDGRNLSFPDLAIPADVSKNLFLRNGEVRKVTVTLSALQLFGD